MSTKTITFNGCTYSCPFADLLPPLKPEERAALRDNIKVHGVLNPIHVDEENVVIDGHNRLELAVELGLQTIPTKIVSGLSAEQKRDLAEDLNLHRRHLSRKQIRRVLARRLLANPGQSDRAVADPMGVDHKTVGAVRRDLEERGEIPHVSVRTDTKGRKKRARTNSKKAVTASTSQALMQPSLSRLAEEFNDSVESVNQAQPILNSGHPDLVREVDAGRLTPDAAEELLRQRLDVSTTKSKKKPWLNHDHLRRITKLSTDVRRLLRVPIKNRGPEPVRLLVHDLRRLADWLDRDVLSHFTEVPNQ